MTHPADIAFDDQADAAEADLARVLEHASPALLGDDMHDTDPAPWLTARLDQFTAELEHGAVQVCEHLAHATTPRPAFGILGTARLACQSCVSTLKPAGHVQCTRCARPAELVEPALVNLGTIALLVLQCDPCARLSAPPAARGEENDAADA